MSAAPAGSGVATRTAPAALAVLISGRGSNMLAIDDACRDGRLTAEVRLVIADRPGAPGLAAARERGLVTHVVDRRAHPTRTDFDAALCAVLETAAPDWVALAGFMRILGPEPVARWRGRMLNIHPSLLPRHPGLDTHRRALEAGDTEHGASVHLVTEGLDAGPVLARAVVPVLPGDDPERLARRVLAREHGLYVRALAACLAGDAPRVTYPHDEPPTSTTS